MKSSSSYTWKELADKFAEIEEPEKSSWIEVEWGDMGNFVKFKNPGGAEFRKKIISLARIAGDKIHFIANQLNIDLEIFNDFNRREEKWFVALWQLSDNFVVLPPKHIQKSKEQKIIELGRVNNLVDASERLCIQLSGYDNPEPGKLEKFWEDHGKQIINVAIGGAVGSLIMWLLLEYF